MDKVIGRVIEFLAAMGGLVVGLFGGWSTGSKVLVVLMAADYVTGVVCALTGHSTKTESGHFWSQVAFAGLLKKGLTMVVILVAALLDRVMAGGAATEGQAMFRSAAEFFYIAAEGLSIIENAGLMGVPIPRPLRQALEALRDKNDGEQE